MWKANHDNQVEIKRIIAARPGLEGRAPLVEKLMAERNHARARIELLEQVIRDLDATQGVLPENGQVQ